MHLTGSANDRSIIDPEETTLDQLCERGPILFASDRRCDRITSSAQVKERVCRKFGDSALQNKTSNPCVAVQGGSAKHSQSSSRSQNNRANIET